MKFKTFTSLLLGGILTAWVVVASAQTQTNGFSAALDPFENLPHDCVTRSPRGADYVTIQSDILLSQSFTACASGAFKGIYLEVFSVTGAGDVQIGISGNAVAWNSTRFFAEGDNGLIHIAEDLNLLNGETYNIKIRPQEGVTIRLWSTKELETEDVLVYDGWTLNGSLNYAVGIDGESFVTSKPETDRMPDYDAEISKPDSPTSAEDLFLVYPNPFYSDCNISFDQPLKGHVEITLSDAQGNTRYTTNRTQVFKGETLNIQPYSTLEPGIYVLRVLNNGNVYHQTIMKN